MPAIVIKDYEWRQTNENVIINLQLVGNPSKIDFLTSDKYLKASYPPYIFELFLWGDVNEEESEITLSKKEAIISLKKTKVGAEWSKLELEDLGKELKRVYRTKALEYSQLSAQQRVKLKNEKLHQLQREAVRAQIDLDTLSLNKIESIRDSHRKEAMKELEEWRLNLENPIFEGIQGKKQENRKAFRAPIKWFKDVEVQNKKEESSSDPQVKKQSNEETKVEESSEKKITERPKGELDHKNECQETKSGKQSCTKNSNDKSENIKEDETSNSEDSESDFEHENYFNNDKSGCLMKEMDEKELKKFCKKKENELERERKLKNKEVIQRFLDRKPMKMNAIFDDPKKSVPLPRKSGRIHVKFSERVFPTPARESVHLEEQEWLDKQAEARRKVGFVSEDLRPEEQNPQWLKDKGDDFFKAGNYLGAISAYTHGIKLSDKMASLYVNRSAAHYALGNYYRCTEDCSKALELMVPKCEGNRESRARCHARRGAALCKLSSPQHGIPELEAALQLTPDNESIKLDLVTAKKYYQLEN